MYIYTREYKIKKKPHKKTHKKCTKRELDVFTNINSNNIL